MVVSATDGANRDAMAYRRLPSGRGNNVVGDAMSGEPTAEIVSISEARKQMETLREAREVRRLRRISRAKAGELEPAPRFPGGIDDLDI